MIGVIQSSLNITDIIYICYENKTMKQMVAL